MHRMGEVTGAAQITASCGPELALGILLVDRSKFADVMNNHPHGAMPWLYVLCMCTDISVLSKLPLVSHLQLFDI